MKVENVSGIDFERKPDEEMYVKQLRCPVLTPFNFNHSQIKENLGDLLERQSCKVLEIGCGWGRNAQFFKDKENVNYFGFDPSETSRRYFEKLGLPKERFYLSHEIDETILNKKYDLIYSVYVLQHIGWPTDGRNTATSVIEALIPCLKKNSMMLFYELDSGQHGWSASGFMDVMKGKGFNVVRHERLPIDEGNDPHDLMIVKQI